MENYDLITKLNYKTMSLGCADCDALVDETVPTADETPEYNIISGDTAVINGKETDGLGELTDEEVEEGIKSQKQGESITDSGIYKTLSSILDNVKKMIWWFFHPGEENKPDFPESDPGANAIVQPSSDGTTGEGPGEDEKPIDENLKLKRGDAVKTVTLDSTEKTLTLENPFGGKNYQYMISATQGTTNAKFEFLANGRLVVTGDNIKMTANTNQKDDIILLGNNCEIDTGNGDDIVRVGYVFDSKQYDIKTGNGALLFSSNGKEYKQSVGNKIDTGSGNDYVSMYGKNININTGADGDRVRLICTEETQNVSGAEQIYQLETITSQSDGIDGWTLQGNIGDCRLFSLINSLCGTNNNGELSKYVTITQNSGSYTVKFQNYTGGTNTTTVTASDINTYKSNRSVFGDLDTILVDIAMNKLISTNRDHGQSSVSTAYYNTLPAYLLGDEHVTTNYPPNNGSDYESRFLRMWNAYANKEVTNFTVGIDERDANDKLGIAGGHAYAVRNVVQGENGYVELVNPWDDADCLRIDYNKFVSMNNFMVIYGTNIFEEQSFYWPNSNNGEITPMTSSGSQGGNLSSLYSGESNTVQQEVQSIENNIEQIKALINAAKSKTIEELS